MAMGICRQGSLSGGELGREIPSAVRGTVQLPFFYSNYMYNYIYGNLALPLMSMSLYIQNSTKK
ncbi:hypothetical protein Hanom_Chr01g00004961 [Helianthus anomalus]